MFLANHIAAFSNMLGHQNAEIIFPFANLDWDTEDDRNLFLNELAALNDNQRIGAE